MAEITLDVRGLEPPEPYEQATALLIRLRPGEYVRMISPRRPRLLYPWLQQHGFSEITLERNPDLFEILIWTAADDAAAAAVKTLS